MAALEKLKVPEQICPDCGIADHVLEDQRSGSIVCTKCGLVIDSKFVSDQSEWRTFAESDRSGPDPNRVGGLTHYLLADEGDLSTAIDSGNLANLQKSTAGSYHSTKLAKAIRDISNYCNRLNLARDIQNNAAEIFKQLMDLKEMKGKKSLHLVATCVYIAAKACRCDRNLRDLCEEFGVDKTFVRKIHSDIMKLKAQDRVIIPTHRSKLERESTAEIYAGYYANKLKLPAEIIKGVKNIVQNIEKMNKLTGKQPGTIAAASIYLGCNVHKEDKNCRTRNEISMVSRVSPHTIITTARLLYPNIKEILPENYGDSNKIQNIHKYEK